MKCMYYLAPNLVSTRQVSDDLHKVGVDDWFLHIISRDEAGLNRDKLHSSNWLETTDLLRDGVIGAIFGFIGGVILTGLLMFFEPLGPTVPWVAMLFLVIVATLFGAWLGGLTGLDSENRKIRRFQNEIEAGQYLILIYARKGQGEVVRKMMSEKHREARHVATDRHFINPFARLEGNQSVRQADQA